MDPANYERYIDLWRGRAGVLKRRKSGSAFTGMLTPELLEGQISGEESYGIYVRHHGDIVYFGMFDLDVPDCRVPHDILMRELSGLRPAVEALLKAVNVMGLGRESYLVEFSGVGFHIWFFFEEPVSAATASNFLRGVRTRAGLPHVPIKPDNASHAQGPFGESIWLPLRKNTNTGLRSVLIKDWEKFDPASYDQSPDMTVMRAVKKIPTQLLDVRQG